MAGDLLSELTPALFSLNMEKEDSTVSPNSVAPHDIEDGEWVDLTNNTPSDSALDMVSEEPSQATLSPQKKNSSVSISPPEDQPFEFSFIVTASDTSAVLVDEEAAVMSKWPSTEDSAAAAPLSTPKCSSEPTGRKTHVHRDALEDGADNGSRESDGDVNQKKSKEAKLFSFSTNPVALCHAVRDTITETRHKKRRAPGDGHPREASGTASKHIHFDSPAAAAPSSSRRCLQPALQVAVSAEKDLEPMRYVIQGVQRLSPEEIARECIWATWTLQEAVGNNFPTCIKRISEPSLSVRPLRSLRYTATGGSTPGDFLDSVPPSYWATPPNGICIPGSTDIFILSPRLRALRACVEDHTVQSTRAGFPSLPYCRMCGHKECVGRQGGKCRKIRCGRCCQVGHYTSRCYQSNPDAWYTRYYALLQKEYNSSLEAIVDAETDDEVSCPPTLSTLLLLRCIACGQLGHIVCHAALKGFSEFLRRCAARALPTERFTVLTGDTFRQKLFEDSGVPLDAHIRWDPEGHCLYPMRARYSNCDESEHVFYSNDLSNRSYTIERATAYSYQSDDFSSSRTDFNKHSNFNQVLFRHPLDRLSTPHPALGQGRHHEGYGITNQLPSLSWRDTGYNHPPYRTDDSGKKYRNSEDRYGYACPW